MLSFYWGCINSESKKIQGIFQTFMLSTLLSTKNFGWYEIKEVIYYQALYIRFYTICGSFFKILLLLYEEEKLYILF